MWQHREQNGGGLSRATAVLFLWDIKTYMDLTQIYALLADAPGAVVVDHRDDDFLLRGIAVAEEKQDGGVIGQRVLAGVADADVCDAAMGALLLVHELLVARKELFAIGFGQRVGTGLAFQELLVLASEEMAVEAFGCKSRLLLRRGG